MISQHEKHVPLWEKLWQTKDLLVSSSVTIFHPSEQEAELYEYGGWNFTSHCN